MGKYRVCSFCGKKNSISVGTCSCGSLLINCPELSDEEDVSNSSLSAESDRLQRYKECPECHFLNLPQAKICANCQETLEDVFDLVEAPEKVGYQSQSEKISAEEDSSLPRYYFSSTTGYKMLIPRGHSVIGQSELMGSDIVKCNKLYVSRCHLYVDNLDDGVYITDVSRNGTFVNGKRIQANTRTKINVGDMVGLGGINETLDKSGYYITLT